MGGASRCYGRNDWKRTITKKWLHYTPVQELCSQTKWIYFHWPSPTSSSVSKGSPLDEANEMYPSPMAEANVKGTANHVSPPKMKPRAPCLGLVATLHSQYDWSTKTVPKFPGDYTIYAIKYAHCFDVVVLWFPCRFLWSRCLYSTRLIRWKDFNKIHAIYFTLPIFFYRQLIFYILHLLLCNLHLIMANIRWVSYP